MDNKKQDGTLFCEEKKENTYNSINGLKTEKIYEQNKEEQIPTEPIAKPQKVPQGIKEEMFNTFLENGYEIQKRLGKGGMGAVYLVENREQCRLEAMKILEIDKRDVRDIDRERFERETQSLKEILTANPNLRIPRVYKKACKIKDWNYYTMEYLEGQSLEDAIKQKKFDEQSIIEIVLEVAQILGVTNQKKIIHRDIKPANIMIIQDVAWLIDFGIAKCLKLDQMTGFGTPIGTPYYMSPEQIQYKEIDTRSDLYSLGAVFYEMLTGQKAIEGNTYAEIANCILNNPLKKPSDYNHKIDKKLEKICLKLLEKEKEKRYQTPLELIQDLKAYQSKQNQSKAKESKITQNSIILLVFCLCIPFFLWKLQVKDIPSILENNSINILKIEVFKIDDKGSTLVDCMAVLKENDLYEIHITSSQRLFINLIRMDDKICIINRYIEPLLAMKTQIFPSQKECFSRGQKKIIILYNTIPLSENTSKIAHLPNQKKNPAFFSWGNPEEGCIVYQ
ncbi:MAG: serine/threonine protein kinase [Candidatus Brocadiae bacterium]|nr:serine/threonine protein kinase [Candidatus Brocadiia bacterium]